MNVSFLGGPRPQRGVGVIAPFDFALDRELWRWVPDDVSLHLTRTPYVPVEVSLDLARLVSEHETLHEAVRALNEVAPEVVAYACTSGSFVGGVAGERAMGEAMIRAGAAHAVTTSGAMLAALAELNAHRIALVTRTPSPSPSPWRSTSPKRASWSPAAPRSAWSGTSGRSRTTTWSPWPTARYGRPHRTPSSSPAPTSPPTTSSPSWKRNCGCR